MTKLKFKFDTKQVLLACGTVLAMLGAASPFVAHAPTWVGVASVVLTAGLNALTHALHSDGAA